MYLPHYAPYGFTVRHLRSKGFHGECGFFVIDEDNKPRMYINEACVRCSFFMLTFMFFLN